MLFIRDDVYCPKLRLSQVTWSVYTANLLAYGRRLLRRKERSSQRHLDSIFCILGFLRDEKRGGAGDFIAMMFLPTRKSTRMPGT